MLRQSSSRQSPKTLGDGRTSFSDTGYAKANNIEFSTHGMEELHGLFSPSILESASRSNSADYMSYPAENAILNDGKSGSIDSSSGFGQTPHMTSGSSVCTTASPSASSTSHNGLDSSCGTTPEPTADSPHYRKASEGILGTVAEETEGRRASASEQAFREQLNTVCGTIDNPIPASFAQPNNASLSPTLAKTPGSEFQGIDWLAQQNGGAFDPVLFGDYRDPQDNIMSGDFGGFFNDAFPIPDFGSPLNPTNLATPGRKRDLMQEIEDQQEGKEPEVVPGETPKQLLTCNMLWSVCSFPCEVQLHKLTAFLVGIVSNNLRRSSRVKLTWMIYAHN